MRLAAAGLLVVPLAAMGCAGGVAGGRDDDDDRDGAIAVSDGEQVLDAAEPEIPGFDAAADGEADSAADSGAPADSGALADSGTDSSAVTDAGVDSGTDARADAGADSGANADSGADLGADADSGADTDASAGPGSDAGCASFSSQILVNPSFDDGGGAWSESGSYAVIYHQDGLPVTAHTPEYLAWLGGYPDADDTLAQTFTVPAAATTLDVSFYYWVDTVELQEGVVYDLLEVQLRDAGGAFLAAVATLTDEDDTGGWTLFSAAFASPWAGETLELRFHGTTDFVDNTNFFVDTVAVTVVVCE